MTEKAREQIPSFALFGLAFRPLFLIAAATSIVVLLIWGLFLGGLLSFAPFGDTLFWHSHEMIFGFVGAVLVGFLLTAVQNWTGIRAPHGVQLVFLVALWLLGRIAVFFGSPLPIWLVALIDLSFLLISAWLLSRPLLEKRQYRNLFTIAVLILLSICNLMSYAGVMTENPALQTNAFHSAVLLITLMMTIIGGRVIPMFTANATQSKAAPRIRWLDRTALGTLWLVFIFQLFFINNLIPQALLASLYALAALLLLARALQWKIWLTFRHPLLWSLHIAYWFIPVGLALIAAHHAGSNLNITTAIHALTVGAMAGMILSMMTRVSLGHTGRPIVAKPLMTVSFVLILAAAITRVLFALIWPEDTQLLLWISIVLWVLAYGLFLVSFSPILIKPRPDGKPG
ncbi:NnrS family protein [Methylophaga sp. OBS4]|uniref:NnrS family protein n=1 Tax=Methylophaga sp. OBS4 TaxID=2991935 RepID=UPI00225844F0|nr:NnrS family protein [Methylophaga sp. OBS4]MCX4187485.1 NnrS family protein [Methylophaga sp. OBS4]